MFSRKLSSVQKLRSLQKSIIDSDEDTDDSTRQSVESAKSIQSCSEKEIPQYCKVQFKHDFLYCILPLVLVEITVGEFVVVESCVQKKSEDLGIVVETFVSLPVTIDPTNTGVVLRMATMNERRRLPSKHEKEFCLLMTCNRYVESHMLPMSIQSVELQFDENVLFVYYTSEHKVDCRPLVKFMLSFHCKARIEMRKMIEGNECVPHDLASYELRTGHYRSESSPTSSLCV